MAAYIGRNSALLIRKYISRAGLYPAFKSPHGCNFPVRGLRLTAQLDKIVSFNLSDIGEGIREVTIKEWFVKEGDKVEQFDKLCEVQSDKASVTITSRFDGIVSKLYYKVDETAYVGKALIDFDVQDEKADDSSSSSSSDSDSASSSKKEDANKASKEDEIASRVKVLATPAPDSASSTKKEDANKASKDDEIASRVKVLATPAVRRIAMENKVDLSKVPATGKQGRVLKGDVLEFLGQIPAGTNKPHPTLLQVQKTAVVPSDRIEVLKGVRKAMFKSMTVSLKIPHFSCSDEIDMTNLVEFRKQLGDIAKERGIKKLTFMPFCIKAASLALKQYPILNSTVDVQNESLIYKGTHNISVAMDTPLGLVVPNVKNCLNKSILDIAKALNDLMERGKAGTLRPEDFAEGTFTLSNVGTIGGTYSHPCIMAPQVSIGAMGRIRIIPRFGPNGEIVKAHIMSVSWSADHRVIDGVTMSSFSNLWKKYLENPALFVIDIN